MNKIQRSINKKIIWALWISLFSLGILCYLALWINGIETIEIEWILPLTILFILLSLSIYYSEFVKPLRKVILQIKLLLAGKEYKKIYTNRTDEIGIIAHFFNEVTNSFERVKAQLAEGKKVTGELEIAGQLQKELMPISPPAIDGFEIALKNRSAEELGGDNFDFITVKNVVYFYVGDVTGHGMPAAIVMTMVNTLLNAFVEVFDSALDVVINTNRRLKKRIRANMFMTMLLLKWDKLSQKMSYIGCGHEHLLVYRQSMRKTDVTVSGGLALGMVADNSKIVKEKEINLQPGDVIVLYTDGITEAKNMKGEMFGLNRLVEKIDQYAGDMSAQQLVEQIARDFSYFVEEHIQEDDVTLIVLKYLGANVAGTVSFDQRVARWSNEVAK